MEELVNNLHELVLSMKINAANADGGNKAAAKRLRKDGLSIEKLSKSIRLLSLGKDK